MGVAQVEGIYCIVEHINASVTAAEVKNMTVRIGDGATLLRYRIINKCLEHQWNIEEVDEAKTSRGLLRHNHSTSAIRIALLRGKRVWQQRVLKPTDGQIRYIQNQSRTDSSGAKTISKQLAAKIGTDDLTMPPSVNFI